MAPPRTKTGPRGTIHAVVLDGLLSFTIRSQPLPPAVADFLSTHIQTIKRLQSRAADDSLDDISTTQESGTAEQVLRPDDFWKSFEEVLRKAGKEWAGLEDSVWAFGPRRMGANLLVDRLAGSKRSYVPPIQWLHALPERVLIEICEQSSTPFGSNSPAFCAGFHCSVTFSAQLPILTCTKSTSRVQHAPAANRR